MKKTVRDVDVRGKRVLLRVDFNVPLGENGKVADDTRIRAALPTIEYLLQNGASVIIMSHLGRPKGKVVESLRLTPVARALENLLGRPVRKLDQVVGPEVEEACLNSRPGDVIMLENLRFEPGETENDPAFAEALARLGEIYVNDAFGAAHRAHASVVGVAQRLPAVAGFLMEKEIKFLSRLLENPERPYAAVLGGSKISDKLRVMENLMGLVDHLLLGGGMCFTLMRAQGLEIGKSLCEEDFLEEARRILQGHYRARLYLPSDVVVAEEFLESASGKVVPADSIPPGWMGLDIGPATVVEYSRVIGGCKTIFWNGPMGVFEWEAFARGTREIGEAIANTEAMKVAGGGDTIAAIRKFGLEGGFTHISTGGGASMEFLEGKKLPGIEALMDAGD
jgi:phosphoglycerate kinase